MWVLISILTISTLLFILIAIRNLQLSREITNLKRLADQGVADSMFDLGDIAARKALPELAEYWYTKGVEATDTEPLISRAQSANQRGLYEIVELQLQAAVLFDCSTAKLTLAAFYREQGINWKESFQLLESAALDGRASCQYQYAMLLLGAIRSGKSPMEVSVAEKKARHFLELARLQKYKPAMRASVARKRKLQEQQQGRQVENQSLTQQGTSAAVSQVSGSRETRYSGPSTPAEDQPISQGIRVNFAMSNGVS